MRPSSAPWPPSAVTSAGSAAALSMTPKADPGLFKRAVACVLMVTINLSSLGQAVAQIIRGPNGAPLTGYTANGTYVQNGVVVGNPHQRLHDLTNPTLWATGAVSFSNSTDPNFAQPTIDQMMSALAPPIDPGGLYLGRLYINPTNPYTAGVGVLSTPPSPTPETGATPPTGPLIDNHEHYARALAHAQANLGDRHADITRWSTTDPALGNGTAYLAKTHVDSSAELRNLHFDAAPGKPVFQATQTTTAGAVGYYAIQGEQAKTHLANIQQQNAALIGTSIFFSQQRLQMPSSTQASTDWEGNVHDPMAGFEASLGSAAQTQWGDPSFTVGYIRPDGQAHEFKLNDRHFQGYASQQGNGEWGASAQDLNRTLGQELGKAAVQHQAGQQAADNIDFGFFKEDRALFMQGMNLYQHVGKNDWYLLDGLKSGQITQGSADYERARELAQQAFRTAYAYHTEYQTQLKHTKESAAYQAKTVDLGRYSDQELFEQGLRLYDKRASERQEQLLRDLQAGRLTPGTPDYVEARALAEARCRVALQKALEPPKKANFFKQLVGVVVAAVVTYFTAGAASVWAAGLTGASTTTVAGVTTVVTSSTAGVAATAIGSAVGAYAGAVVGAGIQTGSLSQALAAGENALKGGVASIVVNTAMAAAGVSAGNLGGTLGVSQATGEALYNGITQGLSQSIAHGGSLGQALLDNVLNAGVDLIAADVASVIGAQTEPGTLGKYAAHAALGCGVGAARSGSGDGCAPAAVGAVTGHLAADGIQVALQDDKGALAQIFNSVPGRTLQDHTIFVGSIVGGTSAALAGGGQNVQGDFALGQGTAENAIKNNYLKFDERKKLEQAQKDCFAGGSDQACATVTVLRQKDQLTDRLLANAAASCKVAECAEVATFIRKEMSDLGCPTLAACPDQKALAAYWSAAQGKAQGLEMVVPEAAWLLDVKAATDLAKWGIKAVAASAGKDSLQALQAISRTTADDAALARVSNNFYREGAPVDLGKSVVQTNPNEAVFWSSRTDGVGGISAAKEIADHFRGKTLEQLIESRQIGMPFYDPVNAKSVQAWIDISTELAKNASGEVRAVLGSSMRPQSIWETYELPALLKNPAVTRIIRVDPKTKKEIVIFERK